MGLFGSVHQGFVQGRARRSQRIAAREIKRLQRRIQARVRAHADSRIRRQKSLRTTGQQGGLVRSSRFEDAFVRRDVRVL